MIFINFSIDWYILLFDIIEAQNKDEESNENSYRRIFLLIAMIIDW